MGGTVRPDSVGPDFQTLPLAATVPDPMTWTPWRLSLVAIAGWMDRQEQEAIAHLRTENRILPEKLGLERTLLNASQKRRLAAAAVRLPPQLLREVGRLFSPDTLLKWHRWLIARQEADRQPAVARRDQETRPKRRMIRRTARLHPLRESENAGSPHHKPATSGFRPNPVVSLVLI